MTVFMRWALALLLLQVSTGEVLARQRPSPQSGLASARLDHVAINAADFDTMLSWYQSKLGFALETQWKVTALGGKRLAYLKRNGSRIELIAAEPGKPLASSPAVFPDAYSQPGSSHFCLQVDNVEVAVSELAARGVPIFFPPTNFALEGTPFYRQVAMVKDPEGNPIELVGNLTTRKLVLTPQK